ncbi:MAG: hypothetical protein P0Y53_19820 [Candidatus Pseudobacter hemicellulosilyticus]|uniref:Uncharacterized protein n=1 Tax=Candidatus Pseudobacter hemicellulosilyticus TaxID=3121375 RepID=A0AAJ5WUL6_9BACT|nr:MAG: hypothetical protein P0Y53_19820 [Pseudobacter sp.]
MTQLQPQPVQQEQPQTNTATAYGIEKKVVEEKGDYLPTLTLIFAEPYGHLCQVSIFDEKLERVAISGMERGDPLWRTYLLAPGRYIVRIGISGQIKDTEILLTMDKTCTVGMANSPGGRQRLQVPELYSSALLYGIGAYRSNHEYYHDPAVAISSENTCQRGAVTESPGSGLFIFLRYSSRERYQQTNNGLPYWDRFRLYDAESGQLIAHFPEYCITGDPVYADNKEDGNGFIGFSANLIPGLYYFIYTAAPGQERVIPIYVYKGWYTQFFMTMAVQPLFGTIRVFMSKDKAYDPAEINHIYTDVCLCKLQNNDFSLDTSLIQRIIEPEFEAPMLTLLGAYLYLLSGETINDGVFQQIIRNLQSNILQDNSSPDLLALNLLSYQHFKKTALENTVVAWGPGAGTPMLRVAYNIIRENAALNPWLVTANSLNDHIAETQALDSPFNTFTRPVDIYRHPSRIALTTRSRYKKLESNYSGIPLLQTYDLQEALDNPANEDEYLIWRPEGNYVSEPRVPYGSRRSWIERAILSLRDSEESFSSVGQLARRLKAPYVTVERALTRLGLK